MAVLFVECNVTFLGPGRHKLQKIILQNVGDNMFFSSKFAAWRVLAVALAITLWGFGSPALRAEHSHDVGQGCCPAPKPVCPAPKPVCPAPKPPEPICCPEPHLQ